MICYPNRTPQTNRRNQNVVTSTNAHGDLVAIPVVSTGADSENLGNVLLLDAALGEEYARGSLRLGLDTLDQHPVEKRNEVFNATEDGLKGRKTTY